MKKPTFILLLTLWGMLFLPSLPPVYATAIIVTTAEDGGGNNGNCSLREAIQAANTNIAVDTCAAGSNSNGDVITIANLTITINLISFIGDEDLNADADFDIFNDSPSLDLTINGSGTTTINGGSLGRVFEVLSGANVNLQNMIITGGITNEDGGGIYNAGLLTLNAVTVTGNQAALAGGGVYSATGTTLSVQNGSVISANDATQQASGLYNDGNAIVDASSIINNLQASYGGGIYNHLSGTLAVQNGSVVSNNAVATDGAGIFNNGTATVSDSSVINNLNAQNGGGIYNYNGSSLTIQSTTISGNTAQNGAGIYNNGGTVTIQIGVLVKNNTASGHGGGLYTASSLAVNLSSSSFLSNTAGGNGGAIMQVGTGTISGLSLALGNVGQGNHANQGGAVYVNDGAFFTSNSLIMDNTATLTGGGLYNNANNDLGLTVVGSCIVNNSNVAFHNNSLTNEQNATSNWWGSATGPGPVGTGAGDTVSTNVDYSSYHTSSILGCPSKTTPTLTPSATTCVIGVVAPTLISPAHRLHMTDTTPTFSWSTISGAQSYRLMIYLEDRSFEYKKRIFNTSYTLQAGEALVAPAKYLWRVRTQDNTCGTWSSWSQRNTLFVD